MKHWLIMLKKIINIFYFVGIFYIILLFISFYKYLYYIYIIFLLYMYSTSIIFIKIAIIFILLLIIIFFFPIKLFLPKYEYKIIRKLLNKNEIDTILKCFNKNEIKIKCFNKYQKIILNKLKKFTKQKLNKKYLSIHHARYSHGNNNFGVQSYHRDIKPNFYTNFSTKKYPNVYTIIIAFDNLEHQQGNEKIILQPGDCLIFNAFNLHRGLTNFNNNNNNKKRRNLQFFNVFFDKNIEEKFYKNHKYSSYFSIKSIRKKSKNYRNFFEFFNLSYLININNFYNKYTTLIDEKSYIASFNNIKYYKKF